MADFISDSNHALGNRIAPVGWNSQFLTILLWQKLKNELQIYFLKGKIAFCVNAESRDNFCEQDLNVMQR